MFDKIRPLLNLYCGSCGTWMKATKVRYNPEGYAMCVKCESINLSLQENPTSWEALWSCINGIYIRKDGIYVTTKKWTIPTKFGTYQL